MGAQTNQRSNYAEGIPRLKREVVRQNDDVIEFRNGGSLVRSSLRRVVISLPEQLPEQSRISIPVFPE